MGFVLVPKSVTSNDLERRNGCYIALFTEFGKPVFRHVTASVRIELIDIVVTCTLSS